MNALSFSTENTSLILNDHPFSNYIDGDILEMTPVNPATTQVRGPNCVNIMKRSDAQVYDLTIRLMRFSDDDVYLSSQLNQDRPVIFKGSLTENYQSETGLDGVSNWSLNGGSLTDQPTQIDNNVDGNFLMEYKIRFNNAIRFI